MAALKANARTHNDSKSSMISTPRVSPVPATALNIISPGIAITMASATTRSALTDPYKRLMSEVNNESGVSGRRSMRRRNGARATAAQNTVLRTTVKILST